MSVSKVEEEFLEVLGDALKEPDLVYIVAMNNLNDKYMECLKEADGGWKRKACHEAFDQASQALHKDNLISRLEYDHQIEDRLGDIEDRLGRVEADLAEKIKSESKEESRSET